MRRAVGSWTRTLAKLGFRRRKRRRGGQYRRVARIEPLEERHLLSVSGPMRGESADELIRLDKAPDDFRVADFWLSTADYTGKSSGRDVKHNAYGLSVDSGLANTSAEWFDPGESWSFRFDTAGLLVGIQFDEFTVGDADRATLVVGNNKPIDIEAKDVEDGFWRAAELIQFAAGETLTLTAIRPEVAVEPQFIGPRFVAEPFTGPVSNEPEQKLPRRTRLTGRAASNLALSVANGKPPEGLWRVAGVQVIGHDDSRMGGFLEVARPRYSDSRARQQPASSGASPEFATLSGGDIIEILDFEMSDDADISRLLVHYELFDDVSEPFHIQLRVSTNGTTPVGDALQTFAVPNANGLWDEGDHWISIPVDFADIEEDYYLMAQANILDDNAANNLLVFAGGLFQSEDGVLHYHGAPGNWTDVVTTQGSSGYALVYVNSNLVYFEEGALDLHLRTHGGNDTIGIVDGAGVGISTWAFGGEGLDNLYGGNLGDRLYGGSGHDMIYGIGGHDSIDGGAGEDYMWGATGDDTLHGGADNDNAFGGDGNDLLSGGGGFNYLYGQAGDDVSRAQPAAGTVFYDGAGDDRYIFEAGNLGFVAVTNDIAGADGTDTLDFSAVTAGVNINLGSIASQTTAGGQLTLFLTTGVEIENVVGTAHSDSIHGNALNNRLEGRGGGDGIWGYGGDDILDGGSGSDSLYGGDGNDELFSGADGGSLDGHAGSDVLHADAGSGTTVFYESAGDDQYIFAAGQLGFVILAPDSGGASGTDTLDFSAMIAAVEVNLASTQTQDMPNGLLDLLIINGVVIEDVVGTSQDDEIYGNGVNNRLDGFGGTDKLQGLAGDDTYVVRVSEPSHVTITDTGGTDTLDFSAWTGTVGITVDLAIAAGVAQWIDTRRKVALQYSPEAAIENVIGSPHADTIFGNSLANRLEGRGGNDLIYGNDGGDEIHGDDGDDWLEGGAGDDVVYGGSGNDSLDGGAGHDALSGGSGADILYGRAGDDSLSGNDGNDDLLGGAGVDELDGGAGNDTLDGGAGNDLLLGGDGDDRLEGGEGADAFEGGEGWDTFDADSGDQNQPPPDNQPPVFDRIGSSQQGGGGQEESDPYELQAYVNEPLYFDVSVYDPEGGPLTFSVTTDDDEPTDGYNGPIWDAARKLFYWSSSLVGLFSFSIVATDNGGASNVLDIVIDVLDRNTPPSITAIYSSLDAGGFSEIGNGYLYFHTFADSRFSYAYDPPPMAVFNGSRWGSRFYYPQSEDEVTFLVYVYDPDSSGGSLSVEAGELSMTNFEELGNGLFRFTLTAELESILPGGIQHDENNVPYVDWYPQPGTPYTDVKTETFSVKISDGAGEAKANIHQGYANVMVGLWDGEWLQIADFPSVAPIVVPDQRYVVHLPVGEVPWEDGYEIEDFLGAGGASGALSKLELETDTAPQHGKIFALTNPLIPDHSDSWTEFTGGVIYDEFGYYIYELRYVPGENFGEFDEDVFAYSLVQRTLSSDSPYEEIDQETITSNVAEVKFVPWARASLGIGMPPAQDNPSTCECSCSCAADPHQAANPNSGSVSGEAKSQGAVAGTFQAGQSPTVGRLDFYAPAGADTIHPTTATVRFYNPANDEQILAEETFELSSGATFRPGEEGATFLPLGSPGLMSGYYLVEAGISQGGSKAFSGKIPVAVIGQDDIGFGPGWNFAGTERLIIPPGGGEPKPILWIRSDGYILTFDSLDTVADEDVNANFLTQAGPAYKLTDKFGNVSTFNEQGRLAEREDPYGNLTTYAYTDANGDGLEFEPTGVFRTIDGHQTSFSYTDHRVTRITDSDGGITDLEYDVNGFLEKITVFDPSGGGNHVVTRYTTDQSGRLTSVEDPDGNVTSYDYNANYPTVAEKNAVITTTYDSGQKTTQVFPRITPYNQLKPRPALRPGGSGGSNGFAPVYHKEIMSTEMDVEKRTGRFTDELGRVTTYEVNDIGHVRKVIDPSGRVTIYGRNAAGQITREFVSDSTASGATVLDDTIYTYDSKFNLLQITYFDGTSEHWTYDSFSRLLSYTDELGRQTLYDYHTADEWASGAAKRVTIRQVVGPQDNPATDPDDLFTDLYYNDVGLLVHEVRRRRDYDGTLLASFVTEYAYTQGEWWLDAVRYGAGDMGVAGIVWVAGDYGNFVEVDYLDHDSFGNPTRVKDQEGRITRYNYGVFDRVLEIIEPDPDGAGPAPHPVTQFVYTPTGRLKEWIRTSIEDPDTPVYSETEIVTRYEYDGRQRLTDIFEDDENENFELFRTQFEYDAVGNRTAVIDPLGRRTEYEYDPLGRPIRIFEADPDGAGPLERPETYLAYDALGRLIAARDPRGSVTRYEYDRRHRTTRVNAPLGAGATFVYDAGGQLQQLINAEGHTTDYDYDDAGRVTAVRLPGQSATPIVTQYDTLGNLRLEIDQLGRVTEYQYDGLARLAKVISPHPTGSDTPGSETGRPVTSFKYWKDGQLKEVKEKLTENSTRTTTYEYDGLGRLETVILPQVWDADANNGAGGQVNPTWFYLYDEFSRLTTVIDPRNFDTRYEYDNLHRVTKVIGAHTSTPGASGETGRPVTEYTYDAAGQVTFMKEKLADPNVWRTTAYAYDQLGRLTRVVEPHPDDGIGWNLEHDPTGPAFPAYAYPFTKYEYDAAGYLTAVLVPELFEDLGEGNWAWQFATTHYAYDAVGRRTSETDPNDGVTRYAYDRTGNLLSLNDPNANTTSWEYDELGRVGGETNALDHSRTFQYDLVGNLKVRTDRNGRVIQYDYDRLDRRTHEKWFADAQDQSADRTIAFGYDLAGRLDASQDPDHEYQYSGYDALDRLVSQMVSIAGAGQDIYFDSKYDAAGNRRRLTANIDGGDFANLYSYDGRGWLTKIVQQANGYYDVAEKHVAFMYDLAGQLTSLQRYASVNTTAPVAASQFTWDFTGRIEEIDHRAGGTPGNGTLLAGYGYAWSQRHHLAAIDFLPDGTNSPFDYSDEDVTYAYDLRGQLTGAQYDGLDDEDYEYDANGNRESGGFQVGPNNRLSTDGTYNYSYDNEGNIVLRTKLSDGSYTEYAWDHRNRLTKVTDFDHEEEEFSRVEYRYDANNKLIGRKVFENGSGTPSESQAFVYENGQIVLEFAGGLGSEALAHRYLWGPAVDQLLADERVHDLFDAGENDVLWALTDHLGTVRDWIDSTGTVLDHAEYDAFGRRLDADTVDAAFGWTGRWRDPLTGLQYNDNRWYDPNIQRWMSEDPIGFAGRDANLSRYVGNEPTRFVDPDGLERSEYRYLPLPDRGRWTGNPGDSWFVFNDPELPNIRYNRGQPDLREYVYRQNGECGIVTIDLDSELSKDGELRRKADHRAAERAMRESYPGWKKQNGYVWHHQYVNPRTGRGQLVLIEERIHRNANHEGAFSFWTKYLDAKGGGNAKALSKARRALGTLSALARRASGPLALVCAADIARTGYAQGGVPGAGDALIRDLMFVDEIESLLGPGINAAHDRFLPEDADERFRRGHRRELDDLLDKYRKK